MKKNILILGIALLGLTSSCSLEPTLADRDSTDIKSMERLRQTMDGSYLHMVDYRFFGRNTVIAGEIRADNMYANGSSNRFPEMSRMDLRPASKDVDDTFKYGYRGISNANIIIHANLSGIIGEQADKDHILGEAYATRALLHFELLKLFGQQYAGGKLGISYIKEFKAAKLQIARGTVDENKAEIYADIETAIIHFSKATTSKYRANKTYITLDAAYALKSRVATYFKDYSLALDASTKIVDKYTVTPLNGVIAYWRNQQPGAASIFELARNSFESSTINGLTYIYRNIGGLGYGDVVAFENLITDIGFDDSDIRGSTSMINNTDDRVYLRNVGKYPTTNPLGSDNIKIFRIEEIVLNHAEALQATGGDALTYLNRITAARGASAYSVATLDNIIKERRKELLFEGFRFHDLARHGLGIRDMNSIQNNHGKIDPGSYKFAMPIPEAEINANREAVQNIGY